MKFASTSYRQVICTGDSQTAGMGLTAGVNDYLTQLNALLLANDAPEYRCWNVGVGGYQTTDLIANDPIHVDTKIVKRGSLNIVVVWAGTNDLGAGTSAAQTWINLQTIGAARRAAGADLILIATTLSRTHAGDVASYNVQRNILNGLIRNGWTSTFDGIVDIASDPNMGYDGAETNGTYFQSIDLIHITATGAGVFAAMVQAAIQQLVSPILRPTFNFAAFASLTAAVPQAVPPGSGALTSSSDLILGQMAPVPGVVSVLRVKFTGAVGNNAGQTVVFSAYKNGTLIPNCTTVSIATTAGAQTGVIAFPPLSYVAGDIFTVQMLTGGGNAGVLSTALADVMTVLS